MACFIYQEISAVGGGVRVTKIKILKKFLKNYFLD